MWAGQFACEAFNYLLKHIVKQERPLGMFPFHHEPCNKSIYNALSRERGGRLWVPFVPFTIHGLFCHILDLPLAIPSSVLALVDPLSLDKFLEDMAFEVGVDRVGRICLLFSVCFSYHIVAYSSLFAE
jgi:hypothetical protein